MPVLEDDWAGVWKTLGFSSEKEMLVDLYVNNGLSLAELSGVLGYSTFSIRRRILNHNIELRPRGGLNNLGKRVLAEISDEELNLSTLEVAAKFNVCSSTVYSERKYRDAFGSNSPAKHSGPPELVAETSADVPSPSGTEQLDLPGPLSRVPEEGSDGDLG